MAVSIDTTQVAILTALRTVLLSWLPSGVEVIRAQVNRVPEPTSDDFVVMTPILRERISTNIDTWSNSSTVSTINATQSTKVTIQLDVHGPNSSENSQIISTLLRDQIGCAAFAAIASNIQTLFASDPRQSPFINGEDQYEDRWMVDAVLQADITLTTSQQFSSKLSVGLIPADITYPP